MTEEKISKSSALSVRKILVFLLKIGFASAIIVWLIRRSDLRIQDVLRVPLFYPLAAFFFLFLQLFLTVVRWHSLLRCIHIRLPFPEVLSLSMQGLFFSLFIPAGSVGGDLIKAGILAKRSPNGTRFNGVFSILVDRICGLIALLLSGFLSFLIFLPEVRGFEPGLRIGIYTVMLVCLGVFFCSVMVLLHDYLYRFPLMKKLLVLLDRFSGGAFSNAGEATAHYRSQWRVLLFWIAATTLVFFPLLAVCLWVLARGVCGRWIPVSITMLASNLSQTAAAVPLTNGGIGVRDAVSAKILAAGGVEVDQAALIPLLYTAVMLILSLCGAVFFVIDSFLLHRDKKETCKNQKDAV